MQRLDAQMEELQRGSEAQCRHLYSTAMPFSEPVRTYHYRRRAYQGLLHVLAGSSRNASNAYRDALRCGIPSPCLLSAAQCNDGVKACTRRLHALKDNRWASGEYTCETAIFECSRVGMTRSAKISYGSLAVKNKSPCGDGSTGLLTHLLSERSLCTTGRERRGCQHHRHGRDE